MRSSSAVLLGALLVGCTSTAPEELLWSGALMRSLARGAAVEVARFSRKKVGEPLPPRLKDALRAHRWDRTHVIP